MPKQSETQQITDLTTLPRSAYIRQPDVLRLYPVSQATLWAYIKNGKFIKPTKIGKRAVAWKLGEVLDWLESQREKAA